MFENERGAIIIAASIRASIQAGDKTSNTNFKADFKRAYDEIVETLTAIRQEQR